MTSLLLGGCATPFLHDPTVETQTVAVKDAWSKMDDAAYFQSLRSEFANLQVEEDAALTRSLQASRDRNMTSYIAWSEPPNAALPDPTRGVNKLCRDVDRRLVELVGSTHPWGRSQEPRPYACPRLASTNRLVAWSRLVPRISTLRADIPPAQGRYRRAVEEFTAARAEWRKAQTKTKEEKPSAEPDLPLVCDKVPPKWATTGTLSADIGVAPLAAYPVDQYKAVVTACHGGGGLVPALGAFRVGGALDAEIGATEGSILRGILARNEQARANAATSDAAAAALSGELKALQKRIEEADTGADSKAFEAALEDAKKALADAPAGAKLIGAEKVATFFEEALKVELAAVDGDKAQDAEASRTTKRVEAVIQLGDAGAKLSDAMRLDNPDRRVSALLIGLAAQRHRIDMLKLDAARESDRLAILEAELLTAATELALLSEARLFLTDVAPTNHGVVSLNDSEQRLAGLSAINRVGLSWSEGRIPMNMTRLRHIYLNRNYRISMAEKTSENWRGLIKPAIDQIAAAGSAGIRPEVLANLLGQLGIAGTIAAK